MRKNFVRLEISDSSRSCFFFSDNKTSGIDDSNRGNGGSWKPCTPVDAICRMVEMTTVEKSSVACTVQKNEKLVS